MTQSAAKKSAVKSAKRIAEDLKLACAGIKSNGAGTFYDKQYGDLDPLVEAVADLTVEVRALRQRVSALEGKAGYAEMNEIAERVQREGK